MHLWDGPPPGVCPVAWNDRRRWHFRHGRWWFTKPGTGDSAGGSDSQPSGDPVRARRNATRKQQKARAAARQAEEDALDPAGAAVRMYERSVVRDRNALRHFKAAPWREIDEDDL